MHIIMWSLSKKPQPDMRMQNRSSFRDTWIWSAKKENDTEIDFENEGLCLFIDGDFVKAKEQP